MTVKTYMRPMAGWWRKNPFFPLALASDRLPQGRPIACPRLNEWCAVMKIVTLHRCQNFEVLDLLGG